MWYSQFVAVDSTAPVPVTFNGVTGIASNSGNLVFAGGANGSDSVALSDFSMFDNVKQRDGRHPVTTRSHRNVHEQPFQCLADRALCGQRHPSWELEPQSHYGFVSAIRSPTALTCLAAQTVLSSVTPTRAPAETTALRYGRKPPTRPSCQPTTGSRIRSLNCSGSASASVSMAARTIALSQTRPSTRCETHACSSRPTLCHRACHRRHPCRPAPADMNLYRCGGNGFNLGALLVGVEFESLDGIVLRNINIYDPSYKRIDLRQIGGALPKGFTGTSSKVTFN
jgi:hypothetical protein